MITSATNFSLLVILILVMFNQVLNCNIFTAFLPSTWSNRLSATFSLNLIISQNNARIVSTRAQRTIRSSLLIILRKLSSNLHIAASPLVLKLLIKIVSTNRRCFRYFSSLKCSRTTAWSLLYCGERNVVAIQWIYHLSSLRMILSYRRLRSSVLYFMFIKWRLLILRF